MWDLKGKVLGRPVYELLGGPQKDRIFCYASATDAGYGLQNSIEWFLELGFRAVKVFLQYGPEDGLEGLRKNEEIVARAREQIGDEVELMVDAWTSPDAEYTIRLAGMLENYRIKWLEDYLRPEDLGSYFRVRERLPGVTWRPESTGTASTRLRTPRPMGWWTSFSRTCSGSGACRPACGSPISPRHTACR